MDDRKKLTVLEELKKRKGIIWGKFEIFEFVDETDEEIRTSRDTTKI